MEKEGTIILNGEVVSGKEEGQYFLSKDRYREQFIDKMGIDPYEGTLNVRLDDESIVKFKKVRTQKGKMIEGFSEGDQEFGHVNTFPVEIEGVKGALVIPEMSEYKDTAEIISNTKLRNELELVDGDEIEVKVFRVN